MKEAPMIVDALEEDYGSPYEVSKRTCEQITAQIAALQKQLRAMPLVDRIYYAAGQCFASKRSFTDHYFDVETIDGVPHINGVAMKEVKK